VALYLVHAFLESDKELSCWLLAWFLPPALLCLVLLPPLHLELPARLPASGDLRLTVRTTC
jgi:hypothetical protein